MGLKNAEKITPGCFFGNLFSGKKAGTRTQIFPKVDTEPGEVRIWDLRDERVINQRATVSKTQGKKGLSGHTGEKRSVHEGGRTHKENNNGTCCRTG